MSRSSVGCCAATACRRRAPSFSSLAAASVLWSAISGDEGLRFGEAARDFHSDVIILQIVLGGDLAVGESDHIMLPKELEAIRLGLAEQFNGILQVELFLGRNARTRLRRFNHLQNIIRCHDLQAVCALLSEVIAGFVAGDAIAPRPKLALGAALKLFETRGNGLEGFLKHIVCGLLRHGTKHKKAQFRDNHPKQRIGQTQALVECRRQAIGADYFHDVIHYSCQARSHDFAAQTILGISSVRFRCRGRTEWEMEMLFSTQDPLILAQAIAALPGLVNRVSTLEAEIAALRKAAKPSGKKCLSLKESAEILGVSQKTVSRFIQRKLLRRSPLTALVRIPREDVEALAKATL